MDKRILKIIRLYIISLLCIACNFFLENSNIIPELIKISDSGRYGSFPTFLIIGLFKYGLLVIGISMILISSFFLIRDKKRQ